MCLHVMLETTNNETMYYVEPFQLETKSYLAYVAGLEISLSIDGLMCIELA